MISSNIWENNLGGDGLICCQMWRKTPGTSTSRWVSPISQCALRSYVILQQYPKSKIFFSKPFPLYDSIADLLGDLRASESVLLDVRRSPEPSFITPSFVIDPVLEEILHQTTTEDRGEGSVCIHLHLCADLANKSNLPQSAQVCPSDKGKQPAFQGLDKEVISSVSYCIICILSHINLCRTRRQKHSIAQHPTSAARVLHLPEMIGANSGTSLQPKDL